MVRAKKAAYENGATLLGDERSGRFSHDMAKGEYRMAGQTGAGALTEEHRLPPRRPVGGAGAPRAMAKGESRRPGQTVVVAITEKHWLLPWPVVEARLRELVR